MGGKQIVSPTTNTYAGEVNNLNTIQSSKLEEGNYVNDEYEIQKNYFSSQQRTPTFFQYNPFLTFNQFLNSFNLVGY